jgi:negative regulator of sigma E activity
MDSFFARNRLSAYLDGTLSDAESVEVSEAIEADPELRREFEALQQAVELLRREGPVEAPAGFHARVMESVRDEPAPGGVVVRLRRAFTRVPVEALALAAAALVVISVVGGRPGGDDAAESDDAVRAAKELALPSSEDGDTRQAAAPAPAPPPQANQMAEPPPAASSKPEQKKSESPPRSKKADLSVPKEPLQTEWEQQPQAGEYQQPTDDAEIAKPFAYRLIVRESNTLYSMNSLAGQYSGKISDSRGRPLKPRPLTEQDDFASLLIAVPEARANALHGDLAAMGGERIAPPAAAPMYSAEGKAVFIVEVRYTP